MKSILSTLTLALVASTFSPVITRAQEQASILGKTDIHGLIEGAPSLPNSPAEAVKWNQQPDSRYQAFYQRTAAAHDAIKQAIAARSKGMPDQASLERQARNQAEANPIIAGMGGIDNIQKMTPEQQRAAAQRSVAAFQQNLVTGGGRNSPQMQAMMQRVMSDPEYRARFQRMTDAEKEAELRSNMGTVAPSTPEQHQKAQQQLAAGKETATAMEIRNELTQMGQRIAEIDAEFATKDQAISKGKGSHEEISQEIGARMAKVPVVELGEYGHDRDPEQVMALEVEQATRDRARAADELTQRAALYQQRKSQYLQVLAAYEVWLKRSLGKIDASMDDPLSGHNTELAVMGYEDGLITLAENLSKYSEATTREAARFENSYLEQSANGGSTAVARQTKPRK